MDIFEFIEGIGKEKSEGHAPLSDPYSCQAYSIRLAGPSFDAYYRSILPGHFGVPQHGASPPISSYARHCILNFAVQQLAVRATFLRNKNRFIFSGASPDDFAASLLRMLPVIDAIWCHPLSGSGREAKERVHEVLDTGAPDDIKAFSIIDHSLDTMLNESPPQSVGLLASTLSADAPHITAALLSEKLSLGGSAIFFGYPLSLKGVPSSLFVKRYETSDAGPLGEAILVARRNHE